MGVGSKCASKYRPFTFECNIAVVVVGTIVKAATASTATAVFLAGSFSRHDYVWQVAAVYARELLCLIRTQPSIT